MGAATKMMLWTYLDKITPPYFEHWPKFNKRPVLRGRDKLLYVLLPTVFLISGFLALLFWFTPMTFVFIGGTALGLTLTVGISGTIGRARYREYFDVLSVAPSGKIGICWLLVTQFSRKNALYLISRQIVLALQVVGGVILFGLLFINNGVDMAFYRFGTVFEVLVILAIIYLDYRYSVLMGVATGVLGATYTHMIVMGFSLFLVIQILTYAVFIVLGSLLPALFQEHGFLLIMTMLVIYVGMREVTVRWLWKRASDRLDMDTGFTLA